MDDFGLADFPFWRTASMISITCKKCKESKTEDNYYPYNNGKASGIRKTCISCIKDYSKIFYKTPDQAKRISDYAKKYSKRLTANQIKTKNIRNAKFMASKRTPETTKIKHLKSNYGLTLDEYNKMLSDQNGVCFICKLVNSNGRSLSVDHCHTSGRVRKLLCSNCNFAVGHINEDPEIAKALCSYIDNEC
jgi:Recombination endonuclease VII